MQISPDEEAGNLPKAVLELAQKSCCDSGTCTPSAAKWNRQWKDASIHNVTDLDDTAFTIIKLLSCN